MNATPPRPDDGLDPAERIERQSRALQGLAEAGLQLVRALVDEVTSGREGPFRGVDPALAYARITRAVRLTIALKGRLGEDEGLAETVEPDTDPKPAAETETVERNERSEHGERGERPDRENLREDLSDAALLSRPQAQVYALICRDLGAAPEPGLFPDGASNDDHPPAANASNAPAEAEPGAAPEAAPVRRRFAASGRASLLGSTAAAPLAGSPWQDAPTIGPFPRAPP